MKTFTAAILIVCTTLRWASAVDAPVKQEVARDEAPKIELKNKSSFEMEESGRNPFWPIGWKPSVKTPTNLNEHLGPEISPNSFLVSSIVIDPGAKFAIVNGKTMSEGQVFGLQLGNQTYQITVKSIQDGQVILLRRDQAIVVPLRRK